MDESYAFHDIWGKMMRSGVLQKATILMETGESPSPSETKFEWLTIGGRSCYYHCTNMGMFVLSWEGILGFTEVTKG